jgi:hypothetical protein
VKKRKSEKENREVPENKEKRVEPRDVTPSNFNNYGVGLTTPVFIYLFIYCVTTELV